MSVPEIVSCEWLHEKMQSCDLGRVMVIDVSWSSKKDSRADYMLRHIPGAQFVDVMSGEHSETFPRNIPNTDTFTAHVQEAGVSSTSHVVVYSDSDVAGYLVGGRARWTFKYFGHEAVSVLDGGLHRWQKLGYPTTAGVQQVQKGDFIATPTPVYRTELDAIVNNVSTQTFQLVDSRKPELHLGNKIPGSINVPVLGLVDSEAGTLKTPQQLQQMFSDAGVDLSTPIVTHCNSGMSSCTVALAASQAGAKKVSLFHGGFTQWSKNLKTD